MSLYMVMCTLSDEPPVSCLPSLKVCFNKRERNESTTQFCLTMLPGIEPGASEASGMQVLCPYMLSYLFGPVYTCVCDKFLGVQLVGETEVAGIWEWHPVEHSLCLVWGPGFESLAITWGHHAKGKLHRWWNGTVVSLLLHLSLTLSFAFWLKNINKTALQAWWDHACMKSRWEPISKRK